MQRALEETGVRAVELSCYGSLVGVLLSIATFRYRKMPYFIAGGIGIACGMAFTEGNANIARQLRPRSDNVEKNEGA